MWCAATGSGTSQAIPPLSTRARVAHLTGRFAPVADEVDLLALEVDGRLPEDLDGVDLRNGPNPCFSSIGSYLYPRRRLPVSSRSTSSSNEPTGST
jgi:hypothetical protein